jgi:chitodextrinase
MGKWTDEALRMKPYIQKGAQSLEDADALEIKTVYPEWDASGVYAVGDKVLYEEILYRCLLAHTAQEDWKPTVAPSVWAKVLIPDEDVIPEWEQPDSTNAYMKGDKVTHNGKTWISDIDNNVWEPGIYGWIIDK